MSRSGSPQFCAVCAWRETCAKKFCVPDGGASCPDFTRDVSLREFREETTLNNDTGRED